MSPDPQKCMKCDKPATHKITKIVKGKVNNLFFCDEHAHTVSPYLPTLKGDQGKLMELLQSFLKQQVEQLNSMASQEGAGEEAEGQPSAAASAICPNCGLAFAAYRKTLLLGCSDCYTAFGDLLTGDLRRMHGATSQQPIPEGEAAGRVAAEPAHAPAEAGAESAEPAASQTPSPLPAGAAAKRLESLRKALQEAIGREDFRAAAQVRDQIRALEATAHRAAKPPAPEEGSAS